MNVINKTLQNSNTQSRAGKHELANSKSFPSFQTVRFGQKTVGAKYLRQMESKNDNTPHNNIDLSHQLTDSTYTSLTAKYESPVVYRNRGTSSNNDQTPNTLSQNILQSSTSTSDAFRLKLTPSNDVNINLSCHIRSKTVTFTSDGITNVSDYFSSNNDTPTTETHNFRTPQIRNKPSKARSPKQVAPNWSSSSNTLSSHKKKRISQTPKSSTSTGSESTNHTIVAITEGRGLARGEVGIAAIDTRRPYLILCQMSDTQTYVNTLRKIHILNPAEILVPNTFTDGPQSTKLFELLHDTFPNATITTVQRKVFSDADGLRQVQGLCLPEYSSIQLILLRKFYALAASAALLKFVEFKQNVIFAPKSIRIEYTTMEDVMFIDLETAQQLELVLNQSIDAKRNDNTLFKVLNKCSTIGGQRRLRALILQPPSNESVINDRLICVSELVENMELMCRLKDILTKFGDIEQLLSLCTQISHLKEDEKTAELQINYALLLKTIVEMLPTLQSLLGNARSQFFCGFRESLDDIRYGKILSCISEVLNEDAHLSKCFTVSMFQRCFSIKPQISDLLDVARIIYYELSGDFNNQVKELSAKYKLPLTVRCLGNKGLTIQLSLKKCNKSFTVKNLPSVFIQVWQSRSTVTMITKELLFLKQRIKQVFREIQLISSVIIFEMLQDIRPHIGCLYKLCENVAELDLLVSFAQVSCSLNYVRPTFGKYTDVKLSRHPILDHISSTTLTSNDIFASVDQNFQVITGPNMGGKSVYIRQVALLQIMGQIGCYVPAEASMFSICDHIFSRIGFNDNIECNASSFMLEMKQMQYILTAVTPHSLIIIDELGRGTSSEEGASIAWAISEELLQTQAFVFFTTHFLFLTKLQDLYCNVTNYYLEALPKEESTEMSGLIYTHKLVNGVSKVEHYGLKLAYTLAIPQSILSKSMEIANELSKKWKPIQSSNMMSSADKEIDSIVIMLLDLFDKGNLDVSIINQVADYIRRNEILDINRSNSPSSSNSENTHHTMLINSNRLRYNSDNNYRDNLDKIYVTTIPLPDANIPVEICDTNFEAVNTNVKSTFNKVHLVNYSTSDTDSPCSSSSNKAAEYANITRGLWRNIRRKMDNVTSERSNSLSKDERRYTNSVSDNSSTYSRSDDFETNSVDISEGGSSSSSKYLHTSTHNARNFGAI